MTNIDLAPGEQKACERYIRPIVDCEDLIAVREVAFIEGYRAAMGIITDRIHFLSDEIDRKPTSYTDAEAQTGYWVERNTLNALLSRLING
jgi:hypothetical protein